MYLWGLQSPLVSFLGEMGLSHSSAETCMLHFLHVQIQNNSAGGNAPGDLVWSVLRADAFFYSMQQCDHQPCDLYTRTSSVELWNKVALKDVKGALHELVLVCIPSNVFLSNAPLLSFAVCYPGYLLVLHTPYRVNLDNFSFHIKVETNKI